MTSPPPSETGATAEERIKKALGLLPHATMDDIAFYVECTVADAQRFHEEKMALLYPDSPDYEAAPILARLVSAAKRSAHLEDARAGCEYCGNKWPALGFNPQPSPDTIRRWVHVKINDAGYYAADCARPEVWDALARTGAK